MNPFYEQLIDGISNRGYGVADQFLPLEDCKALVNLLLHKHQQGSFKAAGIGKSESHQKNKKIRGDSILWLEESTAHELEKKYLAKIQDLINYLNRYCYTGLQTAEVHYAYYPVGSFYKMHVDRFQNDDSRQYSIILYLNENWTPDDGGQLVLIDQDQQRQEILPEMGRIVCFPSHEIAHEVLPAKQPRLSLTGWLKK